VKRQIVFVLSTNYAGSHFLALQVSSHSRCLSLGEFHRYRRSPDRLSRRACDICPSDAECPVFSGVYGASDHALFDRVFQNVGSYSPDVATVVDNSKKPDWAQRFLGLGDYDLRFLHLVRDPRALVRRWALTCKERGEVLKTRLRTARRLLPHAFDILSGPEDNVYAHKWVMQNREITTFLNRHQLSHRLVAYRELVQFPDRVVGDIMGWLGHQYEPSQLGYWNFTHHGSQKARYMKPPEGGKFHDQRWRTDLDVAVQERVAHHPQVNAYLAQIGMRLQDDGLVLHADWAEKAALV